MKSVKEVYDGYSFELAKSNLESLIENEIFKETSDASILIPNSIAQVFILYPEKARSFFKELKSKGYTLEIQPDHQIKILIRINVSAMEKLRSLIETDDEPILDRLLDEESVGKEMDKFIRTNCTLDICKINPVLNGYKISFRSKEILISKQNDEVVLYLGSGKQIPLNRKDETLLLKCLKETFEDSGLVEKATIDLVKSFL